MWRSLIPRLFKDNEDLRLGIVAFGDYCDMMDAHTFGDAYQCMPPTDNANDLIRFVAGSKDTSGGDWPEFYELVLRKIIDETPWREGSTRSVLLIADAVPHEIGYTYSDHVVNNAVDWRQEARKAAQMHIKVDTVTITSEPWFREPFRDNQWNQCAVQDSFQDCRSGEGVGSGTGLREGPLQVRFHRRHVHRPGDARRLLCIQKGTRLL